jgi:serine/threonine-protein kinase HipA
MPEVVLVWQTSDGRLERIIVFSSLGGETLPVGEIVFQGRGRVRQSFFRYARSWFAHPERRPLSPVGLPLRRKGIQGDPHEIPLPFYDAGPDGWGKTVLQYAWPNQIFGMAEFLAAAGDQRTGDLRFGPSPEAGPQRWTPNGEPLVDLPASEQSLEDLLAAAQAVEDGRAEPGHVRLLLGSGADVGGARPKARVRRSDGTSWIAKFPAAGDPFDDPKIEAVCLELARGCGILSSECEVIQIAKRSVLLVRRFDREAGDRPLGYCSAATLLGQAATGYSTNYSYSDVAAKARAAGIEPCEQELFRRVLFNCFISNTDDHLRNHAFVRDGDGWRLSPAFDLVPHRERRLVLRPGRRLDPLPNPVLAIDAHPEFGLTRDEAERIYDQTADGLKQLSRHLDEFEVAARDRDTVSEMMPAAFNPPALRSL